ncbi:MAG: GNAT family N-acetyltransferase [Chloroflexota bacterium]|nr:GNAT family N-acetyltransferase [Chloroflexota bacterium]
MTATATATPLRLWLEPDYDYGRVGGWLLDLPGAFLWASSHDRVVSQAPAAAGWYRDWLERHGEDVAMVFGPTEVVESVPASREVGYERNATFADDARPVAADELELAIRRLGFAREDLLELLDRIAAITGSAGAIPAGTFREEGSAAPVSAERTVDAVAAHLAGAEIWLGSRLRPDARFEGPSRDDDAAAHLNATRAWAVDNLRRLRALDPALARTDGKGETWTLRKVVRRYLYHSIDHLRELDRRLARAEDRAGRLRFEPGKLEDPAPLVRLFRSVGWDRRAGDPDRVRRMLAGSRRTVAAWDGTELVGFAREHGDGVFTALISSVCVDPRWQEMGVAGRVVSSLMDGRPEVRFSLHSAPGLEAFYARFGFERDPHAMVRPRQQ